MIAARSKPHGATSGEVKGHRRAAQPCATRMAAPPPQQHVHRLPNAALEPMATSPGDDECITARQAPPPWKIAMRSSSCEWGPDADTAKDAETEMLRDMETERQRDRKNDRHRDRET